jgi:hypothetical protein
MATKRSPIRRARRLSPTDELKAWACTFKSGRNYFPDLLAIGVEGDAVTNPTTYAAAEEAWHRLGARYMAEREGRRYGDEPLWALEEFGEPHAD